MRIVDKEVIERIKATVVQCVDLNHGMTGSDLYMYLIGSDILFMREDIEQAISEAVTENKVKRLEYTIPGYNSRWFQFYLPSGTKIS